MRCERTYFYAHPEQELTEIQWIHYGRYLHERRGGKPTQYITRKQEFYGREFRVTPNVLIPRPETELLVEAVLKRRQTGLAVDVGTGSGAIAVTLALESGMEVIAIDLSLRALILAGTRGFSRVSFIQSDLLSAIADGSVDIVVSNPPYVAETDRATLQPEVRDWEPALALFAGQDGLDIYRPLIPEAFRVLKTGGLLALEIGYGQAAAVSALCAEFKNLDVLPDLAGIPRVIVCEKP
jgi:release factor glutamine methyltransferase